MAKAGAAPSERRDGAAEALAPAGGNRAVTGAEGVGAARAGPRGVDRYTDLGDVVKVPLLIRLARWLIEIEARRTHADVVFTHHTPEGRHMRIERAFS